MLRRPGPQRPSVARSCPSASAADQSPRTCRTFAGVRWSSGLTAILRAGTWSVAGRDPVARTLASLSGKHHTYREKTRVDPPEERPTADSQSLLSPMSHQDSPDRKGQFVQKLISKERFPQDRASIKTIV